MFKVYLAGPITGLSYGASTDWRGYAKKVLDEASNGQIVAYSPMRGKDYLKNETTITDGAYDKTILSNDQSIVARDSNDCFTADAVLVNLLGAKTVSIGTVLEIGMSYRRCPIILVMEPRPIDGLSNPMVDEGGPANIHEHGMIRHMVGWRCKTLDSGLETVCKVLLP